MLLLFKLADTPISYRREVPDDDTVKALCVNKGRTGEWYASVAVETNEEPPKPVDPDRCVGINVDILKHTRDGRAVGLVLQDERDRLEREQRSLSREQHSNTGSNSG